MKGNYIGNTAIERINILSNLLVVDLSENNISSLKYFSKLINLKELYLSKNQIEKLDGIENIPQLSILDLSSNKIQVLFDKSGIGSTTLITLILNENLLTDLDNLNVKAFPKLKELHVKSNKLSKWYFHFSFFLYNIFTSTS